MSSINIHTKFSDEFSQLSKGCNADINLHLELNKFRDHISLSYAGIKEKESNQKLFSKLPHIRHQEDGIAVVALPGL